MSHQKTRIGIYIGRFQPPHDGHIQAISHIAAQVDELIVFVGSANACRSIKNPWTFDERSDMLRKKIAVRGVRNARFFPLNDHRYNDPLWIAEVQASVSALTTSNQTITLFGHSKECNDYLKWFPEFNFKEVPSFAFGINATEIRTKMLEENDPAMPSSVRDDYAYFKKEAALFADYPFPETLNFNCADVVVECQGHILLIERKFAPGAGTLALPGGFKNRNETFLDCAFRELREETNLRVPEKVLRGSVVSTRLFDSPTRGHGIPRNTLAVNLRISPDSNGSLPRANGSNDASKAVWYPLYAVINELELFDDHAAIISTMTGVNPIPMALV